MSAKRIPPDDEITAMAAELRPCLKTGETIVPFIRRNQQRLLQLVEAESWATLARVMTVLGITYSSGKPWTARYIANEFDRAIIPRKRRRSGAPVTRLIAPFEAQAGQGVPPSPVLQDQTTESAKVAPAIGHPSHVPALPEKRFVFKHAPRLEPPSALTEEELERRGAIDERLFGKK
jgi:hypothetical protein